MTDNVLDRVTVEIPQSTKPDGKELELYISDNILDDEVYSYILYANYKDDKCVSYRLDYNVSQQCAYNTIHKCDIVNDVYTAIMVHDVDQHKRILAFQQPPLELIIQLFDPFVKNIAKSQSMQWKQMDYDDLCQTCRLVMCILYNKGYYLHENLVRRAFLNEVLKQARKQRIDQDTVSIYTPIGSDDEEKITIEDTLRDEQAIEQQEHQEHEEMIQAIFSELKQYIIDVYGKRAFDQLYFEYSTGNTTSIGRAMMKRLRKRLDADGLTRNAFYTKYN